MYHIRLKHHYTIWVPLTAAEICCLGKFGANNRCIDENPLIYSHTQCARALCAGISLDILGLQLTQTQSEKKIMLNHRLKDMLRLNKEHCRQAWCLSWLIQ